MTQRAKTATNSDPWNALFSRPESDYIDLDLLQRFLDHPDPNPAREWLLATT